MSNPGEKAAKQARAARLRQRIDQITGAPAAPEEAAAKGAAAPEAVPANPRDFIARRMRDLAPTKK